MNELANFGFDLAEDKQAPLPGRSSGQTMLELADALSDLGADVELRGYFLLASSQFLFSELELEPVTAAFERVLSLPQLSREMVNNLRVERARGLLSRQQFALALADLDATSEAVSRAPSVLAALERGERPEGFDAERLLSNAAYWYAARAEGEISLGRPSRAAEWLDQAERLATLIDAFPIRWLVFDLRLRQALALSAWDEIEPLIERAQDAGLLDGLSASERAQLDLRRAIARHELRLREDPSDLSELGVIRALSVDESAPPARRSTAAHFAAAYLVGAGDAAGAREALARVAGPSDSAHRPSFEAADLDAIALRIALVEGDGPGARAALEQLERSAARFLDDWAVVAELSSAVAVLQFAQRERVLAELVRGCLAVHGPEAGARRGLEWLHRAQLIGGLARGLGLDRASGSLERDLEWLVGPGRGLVVFQSDRDHSFVFLVDAHALRCFEVGGGERLREAASALANAATRAVHAGADLGDARVHEALTELAELIGARDWLAWLNGLDGVTVVGDESVGHLPLALLETGESERLGARIAMTYAPSMPVAAELARRADDFGKVGFEQFRACLLGAAAAPADVGIEPERMQQWADRLGGRALMRVGEDAVAAALDALGDEHQLLQVVAHGRYDPQRECRAGFLLSGGEVWSDSIERRRMPRLVALAVCGASQRPVLLGDDGRTGLAASFLLAGSNCVLQTPIDLEVEAAVALFERVSVLVGAGASPAEALRDARRGGAGRAPKLQDFLVHAWGAGHAPVVDAATAPARVAPESASALDNTASQAGGSNLARMVLALLALLALLAAWRLARRRLG